MNIVGDSEHFKQPYDHDDEYVSRSDLKKESAEIQKLGERLVTLSKSQLDKIEMDELLYDNILKTKTIKAKTEAYRRHLQYIGKLMRTVDLDALRLSLDHALNKDNHECAKNQITEKTCQRLIAEGDSEVQKVLETYPQLERQKLRQLIRQTKKEQTKNPQAESKSAKELFKYIRAEMTG
ncbi:ribosome biogenesis factor YjgA [Shewanella gelidii]|uniref:Dual-action ribosomal maturation protein DarP n=1 Tax=Shewanella gelidii TaxID=1642821 RepID=A0A917NC98_9GAMM|nr:ribosome biogenesis factor YjgA [Shewanella gelidii]MCL1098777.1 ribosome-associated protein [Shewanella gelidii]GGI87713.1 UPF0307 protein [Shewanella gelidii]